MHAFLPFRVVAACIVILFGSGLTAAESQYTYVVVLQDRAPADGSPAAGEPDIPALGGEVLQRSANRRVVRISAEGIRTLAAHRGVKYIQRVQVEDSLPPLPQSPRLATIAVETTNTPAPTWYSGEYVYDNDGNIVAIGTDTDQSSDGGKESYVYDTASRLADATLKHDTEQSEKYTYDSFGNLVNTARTAGPSTATPTDIATNRLTGYTYDVVGNALSQGGVTTYIYDGLNMMREAVKSNETALYVYTADDERIGVYENGEQRWMIRDLSGKVLREWESTGSVWTWREDHIYGNGTLTAGEREAAEGGRRYFHLDHLGTPRLITDANAKKISAHDYYPFGMESTDFRQEMLDRGTSWPEGMKFTGHERDFSGGITTNNQNQLDYMHARYYSPVAGRFLSVDPVLGEPTRPQSWNRYAYTLNNPMRFTDPTGRQVACANEPKVCKAQDAFPPAPQQEKEPPGDVFVFYSKTHTSKTPVVRGAVEGVALLGLNSKTGFYVGGIGALGGEIGSDENYFGAFKGVEKTTDSPKLEEIDLREVSLGWSGVAGGVGDYKTEKEKGYFVFVTAGQESSVGVGMSREAWGRFLFTPPPGPTYWPLP